MLLSPHSSSLYHWPKLDIMYENMQAAHRLTKAKVFGKNGERFINACLT